MFLFLVCFRNVDTPQLIETLKGKFVIDATCGSSHSACITDDGNLYTWGKGRYGRLGHNDHETQYKPKQVQNDIIYDNHTVEYVCDCLQIYLVSL